MSTNFIFKNLFTFALVSMTFGSSLQIAKADWPMAGGNPERNSHVSEEVAPGQNMKIEWYKPFDSYIKPNIQVISGDGKVYLSTADGLYALDANSGNQVWLFATSMPLGNSPTFSNGVLYVGGLDKNLYAINSADGSLKWKFAASEGIMSNPLVVDGKVIFGDRGGRVYGLDANSGSQNWQFQTGGAVDFSPAYKDGTVYVLSNDNYAYALNSQNGNQIWKSSKLPGAGFESWWAVVYKNYLIIPGADAHKTSATPGLDTQINKTEMETIFPNYTGSSGTVLISPEGNNWPGGAASIDVTKANTAQGARKSIADHYEEKFEWRTIIVLNLATGQEVTFDYDHDGVREGAPLTWFGTHSGNRFPPVVGLDNNNKEILYVDINYFVKNSLEIPRGGTVGWDPESQYLRLTGSDAASDEPDAHAGAGRYMYNSRVCDRVIAIKNVVDPYGANNFKSIVSYNLHTIAPGYDSNIYYDTPNNYTSPFATFGGANGVYGCHGNNNPPVPYNGALYIHRGNSLFKIANNVSSTNMLSKANKPNSAGSSSTNSPSQTDLQTKLNDEVRKVVNAGHMRPGYLSSGIMDLRSLSNCSDRALDYYDITATNIVPLIRALPYLSPDLRTQTENYIKTEVQNYPFTLNHNGWSGANRESYDLPADVNAELNMRTQNSNPNGWSYWQTNPYQIYAAYLYARDVPGVDASAVFAQVKDKLAKVPTDNNVLLKRPNAHNAFIAGYYGYVELSKLAGQGEPADKKAALDSLLNLRSTNFTANSKYVNGSLQDKYCRGFNVANNFMFMTPELASYLATNSPSQARAAIEESQRVAPFWFVSKLDVTHAENGVIEPLYDRNLLLGKAWILGEADLGKYVDTPAFERGDMMYIENLTAVLGPAATVPPCDAMFPDICGSKFRSYIEELAKRGVVRGFGDGTFKPTNTVSRAEMATFIVRGFGFPEDLSGERFKDVDESNSHFKAIQTLKNLGVIQGYGDGSYHPSDPVKRQEVTKFITKSFEKKGITIDMNATNKFPDVAADNQFSPYIAFVSTRTTKSGEIIMGGYSTGLFHGSDSLTREQLSKIVNNSMDSL